MASNERLIPRAPLGRPGGPREPPQAAAPREPPCSGAESVTGGGRATLSARGAERALLHPEIPSTEIAHASDGWSVCVPLGFSPRLCPTVPASEGGPSSSESPRCRSRDPELGTPAAPRILSCRRCPTTRPDTALGCGQRRGWKGTQKGKRVPVHPLGVRVQERTKSGKPRASSIFGGPGSALGCVRPRGAPDSPRGGLSLLFRTAGGGRRPPAAAPGGSREPGGMRGPGKKPRARGCGPARGDGGSGGFSGCDAARGAVLVPSSSQSHGGERGIVLLHRG